ncbi:MAG: ribbon-helix-helix domain-containing protein [Nitrososphaerales archaeon]
MEILNVKVERETKEKIERLVKAKGYKNKSEALRTIIEEHFEEHPELFAETEMKDIVKEAAKMSDTEFNKLAEQIFKGRKSAAEIVAEERER